MRKYYCVIGLSPETAAETGMEPLAVPADCMAVTKPNVLLSPYSNQKIVGQPLASTCPLSLAVVRRTSDACSVLAAGALPGGIGATFVVVKL